MTVEECVALARAGAAVGATEALLTLGDSPEAVHPEAASELDALGVGSTVEHVAAVAAAVLSETGLIPHANAGVLTPAQATLLRASCASQGLMLETTAAVPAHAGCGTKTKEARLAGLAALAASRSPTTTGILIGIGESVSDRLDSLLAIVAAGSAIQEIILQPFRPKAGTPMAAHPPGDALDVLWCVAVARLLAGPGVGIQSPPNLTSSPSAWTALLAAGACDWGGVSPVTADYVSPEAAWPALDALADASARAGLVLTPRLPVYPRFIREPGWLDETGGPASVAAAVRRGADAEGLARATPWRPGGGAGGPWLPPAGPAVDPVSVGVSGVGAAGGAGSGGGSSLPAPAPAHAPRWRVAATSRGTLAGAPSPPRTRTLEQAIVAAAEGRGRMTPATARAARAARADDFDAVLAAADACRSRLRGNDATYVVNRNINYTNVW